jgi:hypothetical protein
MLNHGPALVCPATVTLTGPVVVPDGTAATICVLLQLVIAAAVVVPQKFTALLLCVAPNPAPVIVTDVPTGPTVGVIEFTDSDPISVNCTLLLTIPFTVTVSGPVVFPEGTCTLICVSLQEE